MHAHRYTGFLVPICSYTNRVRRKGVKGFVQNHSHGLLEPSVPSQNNAAIKSQMVGGEGICTKIKAKGGGGEGSCAFVKNFTVLKF
jgi:hypothetical protein